MKVSVLLPVYNGGGELRQALDSILRQDLSEFELIVIDDASTDRSAQVIRRYAAADSRVRPVYHSRNAGLASTLNEGLETARGELVARMDQDDESLPNRLRVQASFLDAHPEVVVAGSFVYHMGARTDRDRLVRFPTESEEIKRTLQRENCIYHPSVMFRRRQILELGGYRPQFKNAEDYDLWLRVSKRFELANIPEPLLRYRFSVGGMTLSRKWEQLYYVYLAQAAAGTKPFGEAERIAAARIAQTNRSDFFTNVASSLVIELIALRLWKDAARVGWRFAKEMGVSRSARATLGLLGRYGRVVRDRPGARFSAARPDRHARQTY